jgi:hypothetical protein
MRRAVIDQPGIRVCLAGFLISVFLGLALKNQISDSRVEYYLNKSVQRLQTDFTIDYDSARINLSKWGLPFPVLEVLHIRLSPKGNGCQSSQVYADELEVPITLPILFGFSTKVPKIRIREMELRVSDSDQCFHAEAPVKAEVAKVEPAKPTEAPKNSPQITDVFSHSTKGELSEVFIEKLKVISSQHPEQPVVLKQINMDLSYAQSRLTNIVVRSKLNAIRDSKSDIYFINANLNLMVNSISPGAADCVLNVDGKLLDGDVQLFAHYITGEPKLNYEVSVGKVSLKALQPLINSAFLRKTSGLDKVPVSISLKNSGEAYIGSHPKIFSTFKKVLINVENAQIKSSAIDVVFDDSRTIVQPFDVIIDSLPLSRLKHLDMLKNKLQSFESLGVLSGKLSYRDNESFKFDGILRGLEIVFSNRGRRDLQPIDEMNFHLKRVKDDYSLEANSLVIGGEKIDGVLNIEHNAEKDRTTAALKLEGSLLSPRVWEQFTFVEQSPEVELSWNYQKAETESYNLKLYADSLELPGVLFSNVHMDVQRLIDAAHSSVVLNIKPTRILTNEKFLDNEYVSEILNASVGIKGQIFSSDKTFVNFSGSDWRNLTFTLDSYLSEPETKNPLHMVLKGVAEQSKGVSSRLILSNKSQAFRFDLTSTNDSPLVVKPL